MVRMVTKHEEKEEEWEKEEGVGRARRAAVKAMRAGETHSKRGNSDRRGCRRLTSCRHGDEGEGDGVFISLDEKTA